MLFESGPNTQPRARKKKIHLIVAGYLILGAGVFWFVRHLDGHALARAFARTRPAGLAVAFLLPLLQLACRGVVFRTLIFPLVWIPWLRVQRFMLATSAATALVPWRAGEIVRAYLLKRDEDVSVASTAAVTAMEKTVEVLALSLILAPVPFLLPNLPGWVSKSMLFTVIAAVVLLLSAVVIVNLPSNRRGDGRSRRTPRRWMASFYAGLEIVRRPSLFFRAVLVSVASWLLDLACLLVVMHAVGVSAPAASGLLVLMAVNLAIAIPVVPGNIGTFELGAIAALQPFGVSSEMGLAVGLLYHLAQVVPIAVLAAFDTRFVVDR
jgi:uncharacterized protein (TIRG00374 family)